jgi:hypothetical protein
MTYSDREQPLNRPASVVGEGGLGLAYVVHLDLASYIRRVCFKEDTVL